MTENNNIPKKRIPPYLPYRTLLTFLERMKIGLPAKVDRSLMQSMSGTAQSQLLATLEYLRLIDSQGNVSDRMQQLVNSEGVDRQKVLSDILKSAYDFLFDDEDFDLERATSNQFEERFTQVGASGNTTRKCISFFTGAAKDAHIKISPHIKKKRGPRPGGVKRKQKAPISRQKSNLSDNGSGAAQQSAALEKLLLEKFPNFDPNWSEDVQAKWFEGFNKLMTELKKSSGEA